MACCVFTALVMNRIIKACEVLDISLLDIQYNAFDDEESSYSASDLKNTLTATRFSIDGMTCAACVTAVETSVSCLDGVKAVSISLPLSRATIVHDENVVPATSISAAISSAGYAARQGERSVSENIELAEQKVRLSDLRGSFGRAITLAVLLTSMNSICGMVPLSLYSCWVRLIVNYTLGLWTQLVTAWFIHRSAWRNGLFSNPNMDTLISLSLLAGLTLSGLDICLYGGNASTQHISSGSFLVSVIIGGRYIQTILQKQTATSLADLYRLQSTTTLVKVRRRSPIPQASVEVSKTAGEMYEEVPALSLQPGDEIMIQPGAIIPCDCYVTAGESIINQSTMTGESLPVNRSVGDFLLSGTRNLASPLTVIISKAQEDSALESMILSISTATEDQGQDRGTDLITSSFVELVIFLATCTSVVTFLHTDTSLPVLLRFNTAVARAMSILASACPCALGLASPSAVLSGISVAWSKGIVMTGGLSTMKKLESLSHMVMDKTGTLTTGKLSVARVVEDLKPWQYMLICAAEKTDALVHPVARSVFQWALLQLDDHDRAEQNKANVTDMKSELGKGVRCRVQLPGFNKEQEIHIGTAEFLQEHDISVPLIAHVTQGSEIVVHISIDHKHMATLFVQDTVRTEAASVVHTLKSQLGLSISILTGDTQAEATRVSNELQIPVLSSRTLPHEKKNAIEELRSQNSQNCVAMVGDGLNDAAALSAADVGILLSPGLSKSTRACVQVADVILTTPHLGGLVEAVLIARATMKQIRFNQRWAATYNAIAVSLAMGILEAQNIRIDASMAGTLMTFSSISVIAMSLWLRRRLFQIDFKKM